MAGTERLHPKPKGPLPEPESYDSESWGPKPDRPGLVAIGTVIDPVPVTGLAANFSPIPRIAPPPLGNEIVGGAVRLGPLRASVWPASVLLLSPAFSLVSSIGFSEPVWNGPVI